MTKWSEQCANIEDDGVACNTRDAVLSVFNSNYIWVDFDQLAESAVTGPLTDEDRADLLSIAWLLTDMGIFKTKRFTGTHSITSCFRLTVYGRFLIKAGYFDSLELWKEACMNYSSNVLARQAEEMFGG